MNLFSPKTSTSLRKKSANALSVFRKTLVDLASVNQEIDKEVETKETQISKLNEEVKEFKTIKSENSVFISKINSFLQTS